MSSISQCPLRNGQIPWTSLHNIFPYMLVSHAGVPCFRTEEAGSHQSLERIRHCCGLLGTVHGLLLLPVSTSYTPAKHCLAHLQLLCSWLLSSICVKVCICIHANHAVVLPKPVSLRLKTLSGSPAVHCTGCFLCNTCQKHHGRPQAKEKLVLSCFCYFQGIGTRSESRRAAKIGSKEYQSIPGAGLHGTFVFHCNHHGPQSIVMLLISPFLDKNSLRGAVSAKVHHCTTGKQLLKAACVDCSVCAGHDRDCREGIGVC